MISTSWDTIYKYLQDGYCFYELYDATGKDLISLNDDNADGESVAIELKNLLDNMKGGKVKLMLTGMKKADKAGGGNDKKRRNFTMYYDLKPTVGPQQQNNGFNMNGGGGGGNQFQMFTMMLELVKSNAATENKMQMQALEHKIDLMNREKEQAPISGYEPIVNLGQQILDMMKAERMAKLGIQPIAGVQPGRPTPQIQPGPEISKDELRYVIDNAIIPLRAFDAEYYNNLPYLVAWVQQNPAMYQDMIKNLKGNGNA